MAARTLSVRWDDFEAAFFIGSPDASYFLNARSGEVVYTSHMDGETVRERVLRQTAGDDWLPLPRATIEDGMAELRAFADSEEDLALKKALTEALGRSAAPLAFNRALGSNVEARRRWSAARMAGIHGRLLAWCEGHDIAIDDDRFRALTTP